MSLLRFLLCDIIGSASFGRFFVTSTPLSTSSRWTLITLISPFGPRLPNAFWNCRETSQCISRRRRHRVASLGRRVAPPWPCKMACLQRLAGTDPVSLQSWPVQRAWGRPGRHLQSLLSERPDARPTWQCRALCAGVPWVNRAMWPNTEYSASVILLQLLLLVLSVKPSYFCCI